MHGDAELPICTVVGSGGSTQHMTWQIPYKVDITGDLSVTLEDHHCVSVRVISKVSFVVDVSALVANGVARVTSSSS